MSWNHRVVRAQYKVGDRVVEEDLLVCEVYYNVNGKPDGFDPTPFVRGDSLDDIRHVLRLMGECLDKPILEIDAMKPLPPKSTFELLGVAREAAETREARLAAAVGHVLDVIEDGGSAADIDHNLLRTALNG